MNKNVLVFAGAFALLATGCDKSPSTGPQVVATGEVVATVNGKAISKSAFEILADEVNERRGANKIPDDKIVEELIKRELLSQDLEKSDAAKDQKFAAKLENAQRMLMSQAAAERFIETVQVTDEDLKKEYDDRVGPREVIAKLSKGEKFDALAKKLSKDPGSKDKGGELGWFNPQQMVQPFSDAVIALKDGETTQNPVQSQFGWHVIVREESREQAPPPFDSVKDQIRNMVQTKKLQDYITGLQTKAKIDRKELPKTEAAPTPEAEPAAAAPQGAPAAAPVEGKAPK